VIDGYYVAIILSHNFVRHELFNGIIPPLPLYPSTHPHTPVTSSAILIPLIALSLHDGVRYRVELNKIMRLDVESTSELLNELAYKLPNRAGWEFKLPTDDFFMKTFPHVALGQNLELTAIERRYLTLTSLPHYHYLRSSINIIDVVWCDIGHMQH
jgi:hypothetical protein